MCKPKKAGRDEHTAQHSARKYSKVALTKCLQLSVSEIPTGNFNKKTKMSNNLHLLFKYYSTGCQLQITFKTFSHFRDVNRTITILTKSLKTKLWCNHTPCIARSLTFLSFMFSLPGGLSGILLLLFLTQVTDRNRHLSSQNSTSSSLLLDIQAYAATAMRICRAMEKQGTCATM